MSIKISQHADVFSFLQYSNDPNCIGQMFLIKNGAAVSTGSTSKDDAFQGIFGTAILNLVAGDQVSPTDKRKDVWSRPSCIYAQIFSPKKTGFPPIKNTFQNLLTFVYLYSMRLFSANPKIFSKKC